MSFLTLIAMGASAALSAYQTNKNNQAIAESEESAVNGTNVQNLQTARQGSVEQERQSREVHQIVGRLRVAASEAGGQDADFAGLETQAAINAHENASVTGANTGNNLARIRSDLDATLASLSGQHRSAVIAGATGALQGLQIGLSLNGLMTSVPEAPPTTVASTLPPTGSGIAPITDTVRTRYTDRMPRIA